MELTPKGIRRIGQRALGDLFRRLLQDRAGRHEIERAGVGHERANEHKTYEFGDPFHLDVGRTIKQRDHAGRARARRCASRPTTSRSSAPSRSRAAATVLMLDVSLSMEMRGRFLAAKKVAMALHALITLAVPARLPRHGQLRARRPRGEARAAPRSHVGLRVGHQHAARADARPQDARQPERPQADHHDHRRRADRPHRRTAIRSSTTRRRRARSR